MRKGLNVRCCAGHTGVGQQAGKPAAAAPPPEADAAADEAEDKEAPAEAKAEQPKEEQGEGLPGEAAPEGSLKEGMAAGENQLAGEAAEGAAQAGEEEAATTEEEQVEKTEAVAGTGAKQGGQGAQPAEGETNSWCTLPEACCMPYLPARFVAVHHASMQFFFSVYNVCSGAVALKSPYHML